MAITQLFNVSNMCSLASSVFNLGLFSNRYMNWAIFASTLLLVGVTEFPLLASIFHFQALPLIDFFDFISLVIPGNMGR